MGDRYLRTIFAFLGINDYQTVSAQELDVVGNDVNAIVNGAISKAKELAKTF
jgi:FMN-dependent NADH-azoreductase